MRLSPFAASSSRISPTNGQRGSVERCSRHYLGRRLSDAPKGHHDHKREAITKRPPVSDGEDGRTGRAAAKAGTRGSGNAQASRSRGCGSRRRGGGCLRNEREESRYELATRTTEAVASCFSLLDGLCRVVSLSRVNGGLCAAGLL